jgi:hypothetical protein
MKHFLDLPNIMVRYVQILTNLNMFYGTDGLYQTGVTVELPVLVLHPTPQTLVGKTASATLVLTDRIRVDDVPEPQVKSSCKRNAGF